MINSILNNGVTACTPNGGAGGNQSPELSWTPGKRHKELRRNNV